MAKSNAIHVAVGVIENTDGAIFISRRHQHLHQGDKWEFPGGKVEADESVYDALCRELQEECNIQVTSATPFTVIQFDYPDKSVILDVWHVHSFTGTVHQREGQEWRWVDRSELEAYPFPEANTRILNLLCQ